MMNKQGHILGSRLGRSGRPVGTIANEMSHNPYVFGLGYKPAIDDWKRKGDELRGRIKAKRTGRQYELVHMPIRGTLNGLCPQRGRFPILWVSRALV